VRYSRIVGGKFEIMSRDIFAFPPVSDLRLYPVRKRP
jgi:hypothetical protein